MRQKWRRATKDTEMFYSSISNPMVCIAMVCIPMVAFHENDGNHKNDEKDEADSDSYKQRVVCWIIENHGNHGEKQKPRKSAAQTTGSPNNGFRNTRSAEDVKGNL